MAKYTRTNRKQQRILLEAGWLLIDIANNDRPYLQAKTDLIRANEARQLALLYQPGGPKFSPEHECVRRGHTGCHARDFLCGCDRDTTNRYGQGRRYRAALVKQKEPAA